MTASGYPAAYVGPTVLFPFFCSPSPTALLSAAEFGLWDAAYEWDPAGFVFLRLAYLTWRRVLQVCPCPSHTAGCSSLRLDNALVRVALLGRNPSSLCVSENILIFTLKDTPAWYTMLSWPGFPCPYSAVISEMKLALTLFIPSYRIFRFAFILRVFMTLSLSLLFGGSLVSATSSFLGLGILEPLGSVSSLLPSSLGRIRWLFFPVLCASCPSSRGP